MLSLSSFGYIHKSLNNSNRLLDKQVLDSHVKIERGKQRKKESKQISSSLALRMLSNAYVYTLSPYRRPARGPSPPNPSALMHEKNLPFTASVTLLFRNHVFVSIMAVLAILYEVLIITLPRVPFSPGETYLELLVSSYISMGIFGVMILVLLSFFWKRRLPHLPRWLDT